jgi:hypothetical protein
MHRLIACGAKAYSPCIPPKYVGVFFDSVFPIDKCGLNLTAKVSNGFTNDPNPLISVHIISVKQS